MLSVFFCAICRLSFCPHPFQHPIHPLQHPIPPAPPAPSPSPSLQCPHLSPTTYTVVPEVYLVYLVYWVYRVTGNQSISCQTNTRQRNHNTSSYKWL